MLVGKRRDWIDARASLHRTGSVFITDFLLVGPVDLPLDGALLLGGALSGLLEGLR